MERGSSSETNDLKFESRNSKFEFPVRPMQPLLHPSPVAVVPRRGTHPIESDLEASEIDRLGEIHIEAGVTPALLVGRGEISAHGDGGHVWRALPRLGNEIISVAVGQPDVAQNDVYFIFIEETEPAGGRTAGGNSVAPAFEDGRECPSSVEMVLDEENGTHGGTTLGVALLYRKRKGRRPGISLRYSKDFSYTTANQDVGGRRKKDRCTRRAGFERISNRDCL